MLYVKEPGFFIGDYMQETSIKTQLLDISGNLKELIGEAEEAVPESSGEMFSGWAAACSTCENRLEDDLLRMAVVGTIKSGKSTFINSLFSGDYLKRGAGVITSIVTKVRGSDNLRATLYFKSWGEINAEIEQSLRIFFSAGIRTKDDPFDIRDGEDRRWLRSALESLASQYLLTNDTRNMDHVVLAAYLKGYPEVANIISDENRTVSYDNEQFPLHRDYSGSEYMSAYLKDIKLEINTGNLEKNIEIADCQGSDSPNPLHLAMIQDYLHTADLVVYIVSSRTGLRQADIKFLSMIKNMAGMNYVLFVVNADFNEHESIGDLQRVAGKVREELGLIVAEPSVYIFSSLFSLFSADRDSLPEKDVMRLEQWERDEALSAFSTKEEDRFKRDFRKMITEQRFSILLKSQVHCLVQIMNDLDKWLEMSRDVLTADNAGAEALLDKIGKEQQEADKIRSMVKTTLDGAVSQLKKEITADVDTFFDPRWGDVIPGILEFVRGYSVPYDQFRNLLKKGDFSDALAAAFQAFKQDLDRYVAENVNPALMGFIRKKEAEIAGYFESMASPYSNMFRASGKKEGLRDNNGSQGADAPQSAKPLLELSSIKKAGGLSIPSAAATLNYTGTIKTEAFMKLGFYRFTSAVKKLFKQYKSPEDRDMPALKAGVRRIKKETEASLLFYFKSYRENIKFQYFSKLIESVAEEMLSRMVDRFYGYQADLIKLKRRADENRDGKAQIVRAIEESQARLAALESKVEKIRKEL